MANTVPIGRAFTLTQNSIYALPARKSTIFHDGSGTITVSNDVAFTASKALTLTNGQAETAAGFVKCTTGDAVVTVKTY